MVTAFWLSSAVENTWLFLVGIVVLRSISRVNTPPSVSMPKRQRRHVEQQHVLDVALQHARLNRRADCDHLVRVHALVRLAAKEVLHRLLNLWHAGHAADQHHLVDLACLDAGVLQRGLAWANRALDQIVDQAFHFGPGQLHGQVLRPGLVSGDERQVDLGLLGRRQLDLRLLRGFFQALQGQPVVAQVDAVLALELIREIIDQAHVEVLAAQEGVAVGGLHLEHAVADLQHRDVERAAAEVVHGDALAILLVETVGQRGGGRLVDDAQHLQARRSCRRPW